MTSSFMNEDLDYILQIAKVVSASQVDSFHLSVQAHAYFPRVKLPAGERTLCSWVGQNAWLALCSQQQNIF